MAEDEIRTRLAHHLDNLNADERRGLLVFLDTLQR